MIELHELLTAIDPAQTDYTEWVSVGMAIKHEGGTVTDWEEWSARDSQRYHPGECAKKWNGFIGSGTPVTAGSLVELAKRHGWRPQPRTWGEDAAYGWETECIHNPYENGRIDPTWVEPADVQAPTDSDWNPAKELITYLETLFEATDYVGYVTECWQNEEGKALPSKGAYTRTAGELITELQRSNSMDTIGTVRPEVGAWIRFNPLDGKGIRDANVTAMRYALIESDSMTIEMQAALYQQLELPVAALVHSGGKSLHAIVRINATTMEEYRERVNFLHKVCNDAGLKIDTQNKNPSRLSRMPGVMRNGNKQYLVGTNQGKATFEEWREAILDRRDDLPDFKCLADVFNDLPPLAEALIDGVLRKGHKMLLCGPSKAGKSWMLLQLALAIAEGREWLGWRCAQGRVLYVNLEIDEASCSHRLKDLYTALDWEPANIGNIDLWHLRGKAVPMDALAPKLIRRALVQRAMGRGYVAIIIDPIYKVITGDENAADKMAFFCNQFDRVCTELKAAVIYCHHHSKGAQGQKSAKDRASGSGVFARDPDVQIDIIELNVTEAMRKAATDRKIANEVADLLDETTDGWRNELSQDAAIVAEQIAAFAKEKIGERLEVHLAPIRHSMGQMTAWRMEGTLREFAPMPPRCFWFRHPFHTTEQADALMDAKAEGEEPAWKAQQEATKEAKANARRERVERLALAFSALSLGGSHVPWGKLAKESGIDDIIEDDGKPTRAASAILKTAELKVCRDGNVRHLEDAEQWESDNPQEKPPTAQDVKWNKKLARLRRAIMQAQRESQDGIARIGAIESIMENVKRGTIKNWLKLCDEYRRNEDGSITPVEGEP